MKSLLPLAAALLAIMPAPLRAEAPADLTAQVQRIANGVKLLNQRYWSPTLAIWLDRPGDPLREHYEGRRNPPWWPSAVAVETLIDFMDATGRADYDSDIQALYASQKDLPARTARVVAELKRREQWSAADEETYQRHLREAAARPTDSHAYYTDFQNEYLDDSGWWGVTWLKMYERTHAPSYLATARTIHAHMAANWRADAGGGIAWAEEPDKRQPNAITNNLFLLLSAQLYTDTHEPIYREWADKTAAWLWAIQLYDGVAVVDRPGNRGDYWSYNQGTFLGGLVALSQATGDSVYLEQAVKVADTMLRLAGLTRPDGVLIEKIGTKGDAILFKGVFARYLGQLRDALLAARLHPETSQRLEAVLQASAASMLQHDVAEDGAFLAEWHEGARDRTASFNAQVSGLALLVATLPRPLHERAP